MKAFNITSISSTHLSCAYSLLMACERKHCGFSVNDSPGPGLACYLLTLKVNIPAHSHYFWNLYVLKCMWRRVDHDS